jgi:hypothetical protein
MSLSIRDEIKIPGNLKSPYKIQEFLDRIPYSTEGRYRSPKSVLSDNKAHCYDGAVFAACALQNLGHPPLIAEMLPNDRDDDHIIALFRRGRYWGSVAKSNFTGLRYREPVYISLRELIMSYFESYFNIRRERKLIGYTSPLNLDRFRRFCWKTNDSTMDLIAGTLDDTSRFRILPPQMYRKLTRIDARSYKAGLLGSDRSGLYRPR